MNEELNISDVRGVIRNLITFIVIDGKEYVHDKRKCEYVASYVCLLARIVNRVADEERASLVEDIAKDISKYIK